MANTLCRRRLWTVRWARGTGTCIRASERQLHSSTAPLEASTSVSISELWVYPVKSCRGQQVQSARLGRRGLAGDREFVIAAPPRAQGRHGGGQGPPVMRMITQRSHPMLACLEPVLSREGAQVFMTLTLRCGTAADASERHRHVLPMTAEPGGTAGLSAVNIWGDVVQCVDQGPDVSAFLSRVLDLPGVRLLRMASEASRHTDAALTPPGCETSLADGFPLLLTARPSLNELARLHGAPLSMGRFRPNVVVTGCHPFEEDSWRALSARVPGGAPRVHLHSVAPSSRCSVPDVDQASGSADAGSVTGTLKRFRNGHRCLEWLSRFREHSRTSSEIFSGKPKATYFGVYQFASLSADASEADPDAVERAEACLHVGQKLSVSGH